VTQLITMEKTALDDGPPPTFDDYDELEGKDAGHKEFNKKAGLQALIAVAILTSACSTPRALPSSRPVGMPCSIRKEESSRQIQLETRLSICQARASSRCIMLCASRNLPSPSSPLHSLTVSPTDRLRLVGSTRSDAVVVKIRVLLSDDR
jgi:hypothetical protein